MVSAILRASANTSSDASVILPSWCQTTDQISPPFMDISQASADLGTVVDGGVGGSGRNTVPDSEDVCGRGLELGVQAVVRDSAEGGL